MTPAFSQVRLKRRRANSKVSFSRTLTLGIGISVGLEAPRGGVDPREGRASRRNPSGEPRMIAGAIGAAQPRAATSRVQPGLQAPPPPPPPGTPRHPTHLRRARTNAALGPGVAARVALAGCQPH